MQQEGDLISPESLVMARARARARREVRGWVDSEQDHLQIYPCQLAVTSGVSQPLIVCVDSLKIGILIFETGPP